MPLTWRATMIGPDEECDGAPVLRTEFDLDRGHGAVVDAVWHATARGVFTASVNGVPVSNEVLSPGWSSYEWRLRYRSYDIADLLRTTSGSAVVLGLELGNGWFRGRLGWRGLRALYGPELGALAQLEISYADGHRQVIVTDGSWHAGPSPVLANDLYDGRDDRRAARGQRLAAPGVRRRRVGSGYTPRSSTPRRSVPTSARWFVASRSSGPVRVWTSPAGATLVDFGQNLVGWVRIAVRGEAGTRP